ncbi:MAG: FAD-dependent oxidoreductase, partial [Propionibacterium sp.]|nr:FAD-dependent oxidoreductase [Propionibacterium sp.]
SHIMAERAVNDPKIDFAWNSTVDSINGENSVESLTLTDTVTGEQRDLDVSGVFVAIGHDPRSEIIRDQVKLDPNGYVLVETETTATSVPGVFACGDLVDHRYRQAITAAGTGCEAALDAEKYLAALND